MQAEPIYGMDDLHTLEDKIKAEIIHGRLVYRDTSDAQHNAVCEAFYKCIRKQMLLRKSSGGIYTSPFSVFLGKISTDYVHPDISIVSDTRIVKENMCFGTPAFILEVSSVSSRHVDYYMKLAAYQSAGVREYWIADLERRIVTVHFFEDEKSPYFFTFRNKARINVLNGVYIDLNEITANPKE